MTLKTCVIFKKDTVILILHYPPWLLFAPVQYGCKMLLFGFEIMLRSLSLGENDYIMAVKN